jgi:hypothetical protein
MSVDKTFIYQIRKTVSLKRFSNVHNFQLDHAVQGDFLTQRSWLMPTVSLWTGIIKATSQGMNVCLKQLLDMQQDI